MRIKNARAAGRGATEWRNPAVQPRFGGQNLRVFLKKALVLGTGFLLALFAAGGASSKFAVGPQYDTTHVYVAPQDFDRLVASLVATFGGTTTKQGVFTVTPTPSSTMSQLVLTPAGTVSVFGFKTPIPYPFGLERTGYLVTDLDGSVKAAQADGAEVVVSPFNDPIGRDAVIRWPGGVNMQLYWHTTPPSYTPLKTIPENRAYLSALRVDEFTRSFLAFSHGKIESDQPDAPGIEIGKSSETYRRVRIRSTFGLLTLLVTDGHLPFPYGRETTGYEVANLEDTLTKAKAAGVSVLIAPYTADHRSAAMVQFPGGYIAEIHSITK
jgi:predicted enzyme related to lactoylglutathione lyase